MALAGAPLAQAQGLVNISASLTNPVNPTHHWNYERITVSARTLTGRQILLPVPGRLTLIIGSLRPGDDRQAADWWNQANSLCARHAVLDCYQAAEGSRQSRQSVSAEMQDRVAILAGHDAPWKPSEESAGAASAYAVLLTPRGEPLWQATGQPGETMPAANLEELLAAAKY